MRRGPGSNNPYLHPSLTQAHGFKLSKGAVAEPDIVDKLIYKGPVLKKCMITTVSTEKSKYSTDGVDYRKVSRMYLISRTPRTR